MRTVVADLSTYGCVAQEALVRVEDVFKALLRHSKIQQRVKNAFNQLVQGGAALSAARQAGKHSGVDINRFECLNVPLLTVKSLWL